MEKEEYRAVREQISCRQKLLPCFFQKINMFCFLREQGQGAVMWRASGNGLRDKANTPVLLSEKVGGV